jgi:hypothetical protein
MRVYFDDVERDYLAARLCDRTDVTDRELTAAFASWVNEVSESAPKSPPRSHSRLVAGAHANRRSGAAVTQARPLVTWGGSGYAVMARGRR